MNYGFIIPTRGRQLIAGLLAGETLEISKVMVGSGQLTEGMEPSEITDLIAPVAIATSTKPLRNGEKVEMVVEYRSDLNGGLDNGFWLNEFGVYAMDGDEEVLIYYATLGTYPQWVSAYREGAVDIRRYPIAIAVSTDVIVEIAYPALAFMTADDVMQFCMTTVLPLFLESAQQLIEKHNADENAHPAIQNEIGELDSRVNLLELMYNTDVSGNPFTITFGELDGLTVEGVHNLTQKRIEF